MRRWIGLLGAAVAVACASTTPIERAPDDAPSWPTLARFVSESEFLQYVEATAEARRARGASQDSYWKQNESDAQPCPPDDPDCGMDEVMVTGSRVARPHVSAASPIATVSGETITNVQTAGVDEGDIVKMIGRFLIVLQDGRLFSVDTGASSEDLALVDRIDIYRRNDADAWYDEILVHENRILVTGFSYGENATEFSVFSLGEDGRFTRESVYYLSSDDYYDTENYATRLVNGNLVIYTPLDVSGLSRGQRIQWPLVRRWLRDGEFEAEMTRGQRLFDGSDIYRPIQPTLEPTVHTISVCPLGSSRPGDELNCRSTAITGPRRREFYVSNDHVYLWLGSDEYDYPRRMDGGGCDTKPEAAFTRANEAALFQISLDSGQPMALFVRGQPYDQMSLEATDSAFHALAVWLDERCDDYPEDLPLRFFSTPLTAFSVRPHAAPEAHFTPLPGPGGRALENRFAVGYLVYGGRNNWSSYPPQDREDLSARVVAVPIETPSAAMALEAPHNIIRVESIGVRAVLTGYRNADSLSVSVLDLQGLPRFTATAELAGRYESEGRSHAFNAAPDEHGSGLMGLPTVQAERRAGRWWWNSESSDVSFLSVDRAGAITTLGELTSDAAENSDPSYVCEVSCIDWYGNSRPIFAHNRVFALSGTELIEGRVAGGRIGETGRVNLTARSSRQTKAH
ncbi:MAG: hypothetical protein A4S17_13265 [Proteobacteria bacterium HN_bin10]|nr:MAG: hypothetical protein A4S17_13265 [Proteobacteria bacterium HN_bin10]